MTKKHFLLTAILAGAVALTASVSAYSAGNSCRVNIRYAAALNGTDLAPGQYKLTWEEHSPSLTVTMTKGGDVVVTVQGRMEERARKFQANMVVYTTQPDGSQVIDEIRLGGTNQAIVFTE
jgi:hypothetical protein